MSQASYTVRLAIKELADAIVNMPARSKDPELKQALKHVTKAIKLLKDDRMLFDEWSQDDVLEVAKYSNIKLSKTKAKEVLEVMSYSFDANCGINWEFIESCIYRVTGGRQ